MVLAALAAHAQSPAEAYIEKWHPIAIAEMQQFGIPASITLAQGILESSSGQSMLATKANNHFGIKCHLDWTGRKVYKDDDEKDECFRAYRKAEDSFRDHSLFLKNRSRYAGLFEEDPTDYKAWAKGLKKAGYATDRSYPQRLIELIEKHRLHDYDLMAYNTDSLSKSEYQDIFINESPNRVKYVIAREGDTFEKLAQLTERKPRDLLEHNELRYDAQLEKGQIIYLQRKRRRATRDQRSHRVLRGEDMYDISQRYAIRLYKLYEMNDMKVGEQPNPGRELQLR